MSNTMKAAVGLLLVHALIAQREINRNYKFNKHLIKCCEKRTELISYLATKIDSEGGEVTEFDKIALTDIMND